MRCEAVWCGTSNLHNVMKASCRSLLAHSHVDHCYLLTDKIPKDQYYLDDPRVEWRVVDNKWFNSDGPNMTSQFTWMAMLRAALIHVLPDDLDVVLSLDCDTICVGNIDDVWKLPVDEFYFSASMEPARSKFGLQYCNTGVALYNLKKLRDGKADEVIDVLNRQRFTYVEQDVFNYLCQGYILDMPSRFNTTEFTLKCVAPRIKHFAGKKYYINEAEFREWL